MFNRELLKGSTALIILQLLAEKDLYGYQLVKEMEQRSEYQLQVKEGTLYPALHKLEQNGYIVSYWQEQEKGPARKYYRLTSEGQQTLQEKTTEWTSFVQMINRVLKRT